MFTISTWIFLNYLFNIRIKMLWFFRLLLSQDINLQLAYISLNKISTKLRKVSMFILFILWIQSASILIKAFSGVLLNNYFNTKTFPMVDEFQDIIDNKKMLVVMDPSVLVNFGNQNKKSVNKLNLDEISKRTKLFKKMNNDTYDVAWRNPEVHDLVIYGKAVIIFHTTTRKEFFQTYPHLKDRVGVAPVKYLHEKLCYSVNKKNIVAKEVLYL